MKPSVKCKCSHFIICNDSPSHRPPTARWNSLWERAQLPVLIVTHAVEGTIINPVTVKDCDGAQAWRKPTYATHQTPHCSPSKWSVLCVDGRSRMTCLKDGDVYLIAHTSCLVLAAVLVRWNAFFFFSEQSGCHFSLAAENDARAVMEHCT